MFFKLGPLITLLTVLLVVACGGIDPAVPATLVRVTPLPTNTAKPPAQIVTPTAIETATTAIAADMDAFLTAETEAGRFSGAALVARGDEVILAKGYGLANLADGVPNSTSTIFPIGTLTLPFTAMAIMQLQEQGLLDITDSICDYIDDCPPSWEQVEIQHVLAQASGIYGSWSVLNYQEESGRYVLPEDVVAQAQDGRLLFEPGTRWLGDIAQSDYLLLGIIIEAASGRSYADYLQENIFDPLEMVDTDLGYSEGTAEERPARGSNGRNSLSNLKPLFSRPASRRRSMTCIVGDRHYYQTSLYPMRFWSKSTVLERQWIPNSTQAMAGS